MLSQNIPSKQCSNHRVLGIKVSQQDHLSPSVLRTTAVPLFWTCVSTCTPANCMVSFLPEALSELHHLFRRRASCRVLLGRGSPSQSSDEQQLGALHAHLLFAWCCSLWATAILNCCVLTFIWNASTAVALLGRLGSSKCQTAWEGLWEKQTEADLANTDWPFSEQSSTCAHNWSSCRVTTPKLRQLQARATREALFRTLRRRERRMDTRSWPLPHTKLLAP